MLIAIVCHENRGVGSAKLDVLKLDKFIHIWDEAPKIMTVPYPQRHINGGPKHAPGTQMLLDVSRLLGRPEGSSLAGG
jgi:hypothetical protein